jgi:hypothetical protein
VVEQFSTDMPSKSKPSINHALLDFSQERDNLPRWERKSLSLTQSLEIDDFSKSFEPRKGARASFLGCCCCGCCCASKKRCAVTTLSVLLLSMMVGALGWWFLGHMYVQNLMDQVTLSVRDASLRVPAAPASGQMQQAVHVELALGASMVGTLPPVNVVLLATTLDVTFQGTTLGDLLISDTTLSSSDPDFDLESVMHVTNHTAYEEFLAILALSDEVTLTSSGVVQLNVLSFVPFFGIHFQQPLSFAGLRNLGNGDEQLNVKVFALEQSEGHSSPSVSVAMALYNPSSFGFPGLGDVTFDCYVQDELVLQVFGASLQMNRNWTVAPMTGDLTRELVHNNNPGAVALFSNYLAGKPTFLSVHNGRSTEPAFSASIHALHLNVTFPGTSDSLIKYAVATYSLAWMTLQLFTTFGVTVPIDLTLFNPLDVPVVVTRLDFRVFFQGTDIMGIHRNVRFTLPPRQNFQTQGITGRAQANGRGRLLNVISLFFNQVSAGLTLVNTSGTVGVELGDIALTLEYRANDMPVCPSDNSVGCEQASRGRPEVLD